MTTRDIRQTESESIHPPPPQTCSARHPVIAILVTLAAMAVVLLLAEVIARKFAPPSNLESNSMFILDADVGWRFPAHHTIPRIDDWFGKPLELPYITNNRGLKGVRDYPIRKETDELRVLALGDSTANMTHFDGYPEILERLLVEALPEKKVWVQNAGINGFSSLNVRFMAREEIPLFNPDYVIVTVGTDDVLLSNRPDRVDYEITNFGEMIARLGQHTRLVTWARRSVPQSLIQPLMNTPGASIAGIDREEMVPRTSPEEIHENFIRIVDITRDNNAVPILTLQPWLFWNLQEYRPEELHIPLTPWSQEIWNVAQQKDTYLVNAIELFDRPDRAAFWMVHANPNNDPWGMHSDPVHLNMAGNELLAAEYAKVILNDLTAKNPALKVNMQPIEEMVAKHQKTPENDPDFVRGIPTEAYYEHITERMREANKDENPEPWKK